MGNLQSATHHPGGPLSKSELERIQRRVIRLGRGRPELARSDLHQCIQINNSTSSMLTNPYIDAIFSLYDTDGDGLLGMDDVYTLLEDLSRLPRNRDDQLTFAFKVFDARSQDGILDRDELHAVLDSATRTHRHALSSEHENDLTRRIVDAMIQDEDCEKKSESEAKSEEEEQVGLTMTQFKKIFTSNV